MKIKMTLSYSLILIASALLMYTVFAASFVSAAKPDNGVCAITDRNCTILASDNSEVTVGFDDWGYNYQGHMFSGKYCDAYRDAAWCQPYKDTNLSMKWNDAWIANTSADGDAYLDRHYGHASYIGSGAWLTNHMSGVNDDGSKWTYFVKIVAAPADAYTDNGFWYAADGTEIGEIIWGQFAVIQTISNDPANSEHGAQYVSPMGPGFGQF